MKKPVVVLSNNDGCIVSRTDEAKKLGVGMAAPYYQNKDVIERNDVAVFSSNYNLYGDLSARVMDTLRELIGARNVEVYSVDEAFLGVAGLQRLDHRYDTPVSCSETSHSRRAASGSCAVLDADTILGDPRPSKIPFGPA